jgi:hypothetical protein
MSLVVKKKQKVEKILNLVVKKKKVLRILKKKPTKI